MKPVLYSYYRSSCAFRTRIALHLKKIDFEYRAVPLLENAQKQESYLSFNPKGEVPCLVHGDTVISQSMAIIDYIDKEYPSPPLFPSSNKKTALCLQLCEVINAGIQPLQNLSTTNYLAKTLSLPSEQKEEWIHHWIKNGLTAFEKMLSPHSGKYCLGDDISCADLFLIPQMFSARRFGIKTSSYPLLASIEENCMKQDAFTQSIPDAMPDAPR